MIEKRRFVRVDSPIRVRYALEGEKKSSGKATSKNVSASGICMFLKDLIRAGSNVNLVLTLPGAHGQVKTGAEVIWIDKADNHRATRGTVFEAGLKFTALSHQGKAVLINFVFESLKGRNGNTYSPPD